MAAPTKALWGLAGLVAAGSAAIVLGAKQTKREVTIPAGTEIVAVLQSAVSTKASQPGESITLITDRPLQIDEDNVIPEGVVIRGHVTKAEGGGRMAGAPELGLAFDALEVDGGHYEIDAKSFYVKGKSDARKSAAQVGGGAVAGGILGGLLGGKDDAVKGAVVGAVIGTGVAVATDGDDIFLRNGQKLEVRLAEPVTVEFKPATSEESEEDES